MHLRRTLALAICATLPFALTGCVKDFATDRVNTVANGVSNRDGSVDVLNAVIVSTEQGSGTFIASFANNSTEEPASFETLEGIDQSQLTAKSFSPIEIPASGLVNLANEGGIEVEGDFEAGDFVPVSIQFASGEAVELDVHVVTNCGIYEGLDGPADPEQCEAPESTVEY